MKRIATFASIALLAVSNVVARGDVKVPAIFGDHMVLQREAKIPIWGKAEAGEKVTIKVGDKAAGQEKSATADDKGKWRITLDPIQANEKNEPIELTITGKNTIAIKDVLVGEVWVCSGQSNMGFPLQGSSNGAAAVKAADHPTMRLFTVGRSIPNEPQDELSEGKWEICTPESAKAFSAVAYFFGLELQENLKQPIGLIEPSWGGTRAEAWMPKPTFDALKLPYEPEWTEQWLHPKANAKSNTTSNAPTTKPEPSRPHEAPAVLYNGMIAPIAGYAMRGVIWYQGETNTAYGEHYRKVLGALITSWRTAWGQGDFPFLVVQLANLQNNRFWPTLREGQVQVSKDLPNIGLVVTIDVGNPKDIHPKDKKTVGQRLALSARKIAYGQDIAYSGPMFKSMKVTGADAVIAFDHVNGGLIAKGGELLGFEIAGDDGKFVPAKAVIDGDYVRVTAADVASPKTVRYAWANDPQCTLYNEANLPAVPFEAKGE